MFTNKCREIKEVSSNNDKVDKVTIIDTTNIEFVKINSQSRMAKFKNMV